MRILFRPQRSAEQITYTFRGESVTALIGDAEDAIEDTFDFTGLPDGEIDTEQEIETTLPACPIISARRVDGILHLEMLNWIGSDAPRESRFPEWVDLPLPPKEGAGGAKIKPGAPATNIPWRSRAEIFAEQRAVEAAEREKQERRTRIREGLSTAKTQAELKTVMMDMAAELGLLEAGK